MAADDKSVMVKFFAKLIIISLILNQLAWSCDDLELMRSIALENLNQRLVEIQNSSLRETDEYKETFKMCSTSGFTAENFSKFNYLINGLTDIDDLSTAMIMLDKKKSKPGFMKSSFTQMNLFN